MSKTTLVIIFTSICLVSSIGVRLAQGLNLGDKLAKEFVLNAAELIGPDDVVLVANQNHWAFFSNVKFIRDLDPRLAEVYQSQNINEFAEGFENLGITHVAMPRRSTLPLTSTLLGELLGSHRADIVYTYAGFDLFKIHSKSSALGDPTSKRYKEIGFKKSLQSSYYQNISDEETTYKEYILSTIEISKAVKFDFLAKGNGFVKIRTKSLSGMQNTLITSTFQGRRNFTRVISTGNPSVPATVHLMFVCEEGKAVA